MPFRSALRRVAGRTATLAQYRALGLAPLPGGQGAAASTAARGLCAATGPGPVADGSLAWRPPADRPSVAAVGRGASLFPASCGALLPVTAYRHAFFNSPVYPDAAAMARVDPEAFIGDAVRVRSGRPPPS